MSVFPTKSRFRRRDKRCYELAFRTMCDIAKAGNADFVTLVHGTVKFPDDASIVWGYGHAWLEDVREGEVYDAVKHETMPVVQYVAERSAIVWRRYTWKDAAHLCRTEGHLGPWHDRRNWGRP